ncbi:hypothetical protein TNCV_4702341 [Trichonephila clavipes]|nr:hypothetical protein TNCV_4702341 [Trichonephila clavipes]
MDSDICGEDKNAILLNKLDDSLFLSTWTDKQSSNPYHDVFDARLDFVGFYSLRSDMTAIGCGDGIREERGLEMTTWSFIRKSEKKKLSLQKDLWDILQNLPSEISDVLTDNFSDEEVPENNLVELSLDSEDDNQETEQDSMSGSLY